MTGFAIGEIAITQNCVDPRNNGCECEIIGGLENRLTHSAANPDVSWFDLAYLVSFEGIERIAVPHKLRKKHPPATDEATARQAMLDCIERARLPQGVPA